MAASGKPLTEFLLELSHSPELAKRFSSSTEGRNAVLAERGLSDDAFGSGEPTLQEVQDAVAAENPGVSVGVTWWIWFFGDPT